MIIYNDFFEILKIYVTFGEDYEYANNWKPLIFDHFYYFYDFFTVKTIKVPGKKSIVGTLQQI